MRRDIVNLHVDNTPVWQYLWKQMQPEENDTTSDANYGGEGETLLSNIHEITNGQNPSRSIFAEIEVPDFDEIIKRRSYEDMFLPEEFYLFSDDVVNNNLTDEYHYQMREETAPSVSWFGCWMPRLPSRQTVLKMIGIGSTIAFFVIWNYCDGPQILTDIINVEEVRNASTKGLDLPVISEGDPKEEIGSSDEGEQVNVEEVMSSNEEVQSKENLSVISKGDPKKEIGSNDEGKQTEEREHISKNVLKKVYKAAAKNQQKSNIETTEVHVQSSSSGTAEVQALSSEKSGSIHDSPQSSGEDKK